MILWILIVILAVVIYVANQHFFSYWTRRGFAQTNPIFFFGDGFELLTVTRSVGEYFQKYYQKYRKHKLLGIYMSYRPVLIVQDPEFINDLLKRDFTNFQNNENYHSFAGNLIFLTLIFLSGQKWRDLRVKLSPVFTSNKLKGMFPIYRDCARVLEDYVAKNVNNDDDIFDMYDLFARFTINSISSVGFGIENDCINERDNIFYKMSLRAANLSFQQFFAASILLASTKLFKVLKLKLTHRDVEDFFLSITRKSIEFRENNKDYKRKDLMQLMIQLKNQGFVTADKEDKNEIEKESSEIKKLTIEQVAAQTFVFFAAGFETSTSTTNFTLFELCKNPKIQQKVHDEIDKILKSRNIKDITYETLAEMKYLERCIDETLRKYPIIPFLNRKTTKNYTFTGTNQTISKRTPIFIPVLGLHRDSEIYENPMEFKPERFLNSTTGNGNAKGLFYLPFGDGPRNCIAARMGKLQTKIGLLTVLLNFKFELVDESYLQKEIEFDVKQFVLKSREVIKMRAMKR